MNEYVRLVSEITGDKPKDTHKKMNRIRKLYGISFKRFYENKMYEIPDWLLEKEALKTQLKIERRAEAYESIAKHGGLTKEQIISELGHINEKDIKHINVLLYDKFQMYAMSEEELEETLHTLNKRDDICKEIKADLEAIDAGEKDYSDIESKTEELRKIVRSMMTPVFREKLTEIYAKGRDDVEAADLEEIFIDMDVTRLLLGFSFNEYLSFHFESKTMEEKREYMNNKERMEALRSYNDDESCNMLDHKAECYNRLTAQFGRKQVLIDSKYDIMKFVSFCMNRDVFVKKAVAKSMGKGIEPIHIGRKTNLVKLLKKLLEETGGFIAEEMIYQDDSMKAFNDTSVNTVRLETFFDGKEVKIMDSFMRTGQNGAFVDNGGAGGIFAAVDTVTGVVSGDGIDEFGKIYTTHPQSGIRFEGFELKDWDKALALVKGAGRMFPGVSFIGWDLAYTDKKEWVIVEGNAKPQIIGNQATQRRGLKYDFLNKINQQ